MAGKGDHVMISYQWDHQETMLWVRDQLQQGGYEVWMDVDDMEGDLLEAMAEAVEESAVVLVGMSRAYKKSENCKKEASYATKKKKDIIPLLLEKSYEADGWLGLMLGMKLYYDFSDKSKRESSMAQLMAALKDRGRSKPDATPASDVALEVHPTTSPKQEESSATSQVRPLENAKQVREFNVQLPGEKGVMSYYIHYSDGKYFVTDTKNKKVKIFSQEGQFKCLLDDGQKLKDPRGVTNGSQGEIIVVDYGIRGFVVYDKHLKQQKVVRQVCGGKDITCVDNQLVVIGYESKDGLTILNMEGEVQGRVNEKTLGFDDFDAKFVTTSNTGRLIISVWDPMQGVAILNSECSAFAHSCVPHGDMALAAAQGVACDERGYIVLADGGAGNLHLVTTAGEHKGMIATQEDDLLCPYGVTICGPGLVAVVELNGAVRIFKYLDI